jgi:hypothetical protein
MKNKNLSLLTLMLTLWAVNDCTIDHNNTTDSTTVTSPDGNCSVTVPTDEYEWLTENFPNEGEEAAQAIGTENLNEGVTASTQASVVAANEAE